LVNEPLHLPLYDLNIPVNPILKAKAGFYGLLRMNGGGMVGAWVQVGIEQFHYLSVIHFGVLVQQVAGHKTGLHIAGLAAAPFNVTKAYVVVVANDLKDLMVHSFSFLITDFSAWVYPILA
jgi:hypothetical protein